MINTDAVWATCTNAVPEPNGVFHDLRELAISEARLTMFQAVQQFNTELNADVEVLQMRQCAKCALVFVEFIGPAGGSLLFVHLPPEGLMI